MLAIYVPKRYVSLHIHTLKLEYPLFDTYFIYFPCSKQGLCIAPRSPELLQGLLLLQQGSALSLQHTSRVAEPSPFLHPCQPELAFQPSCASWRLNKRRRPRDGKLGAEDSRITQDSQSSVFLPGVLGRCHNPRWGCAERFCTGSVLQDDRGTLPAPDTYGPRRVRTDRRAHREKVSQSGGGSAHLGQCKHTPAHAIKREYYLAKDYGV